MKQFLCSLFVALVVTAVAVPSYAVVTPVDDSPGANLGGYIAQSSAMAFSLQPFLPALIPTGDVPFEGTIALSTSNVKSGGNSFARGSALWLGSAAGDPGPLIGQGAKQPAVGEVFPKWPVQAQATQTDGEVTAGKDPILLMTAKAFPDRSVGDTRIANVDAPGLVRIEHVASTSTSLVHDTDVTNDARVVLHGIALINGHITIDQLRSYSATTSNGTNSTQTGNTVVSGLKIGGVNVAVTDAGFQIQGLPPGSEQAPGAGGKPFPGQSPAEAVNSVLNAFHARLTMFRSVGSASGGNADRLSGALVLSIDNPIGGTGPIPPGRFDVILGSTSSTTQVSSQFLSGIGGVGGGGVVTGGGDASRGDVPGSVSLGSGPAPSATTVSSVGKIGNSAIGSTSENPSLQTTDYRFKGLPVGMVILFLLVAVVVSRYIRRFMNTVIGGTER